MNTTLDQMKEIREWKRNSVAALAFASPDKLAAAQDLLAQSDNEFGDTFSLFTPYPVQSEFRQMFGIPRDNPESWRALEAVDSVLARYKFQANEAGRPQDAISYGISLRFPFWKFQAKPVVEDDGVVVATFCSTDGFPIESYRSEETGEIVFSRPTGHVITAVMYDDGEMNYDVAFWGCYPAMVPKGEIQFLTKGLEWRPKVGVSRDSAFRGRQVIREIDDEQELIRRTRIQRNFLEVMKRRMSELSQA